VGTDSPFAGTYVPLSRYGTDARVASLMLEIRRDVLDEQEAAVARALAALVDAVRVR
jgi:N-formylglutamate deformylase